MMLYICTKLHEKKIKSVRVIERTQNDDGRTDRRTDQMIIIGPPPTVVCRGLIKLSLERASVK